MSYSQDNEAEQLRKQLKRAEEGRDWQREMRLTAEKDAAHQRRKAAAARGQLTKTKKRIAKGICPCCNRSFVNLERHMTGQHPDYAPGAASGVEQ